MKTYKVLLSNGMNLSLKLPGFSNKERKLQKVLKLFYIATVTLLFGFLFVLPFSGYIFSGVNFESNVFSFTIYSILILAILFLSILTIGGRSWLTDPTNFLSVLIFGLFTTSAAVLATPSSINNTFGTSVLRSVSGLYVMISIGIFYFLNVFIRDRFALKKVIYTLTAGFAILLGILSLNSFSDLSIIPTELINIFPLFIFLSFVILFVRSKKFSLILFLLSAILVGLYFQGYKGSMLTTTYLLTSTFLASLIIALFYIFNNKKFLSKRVKELKTNLKKFKKSDKSLILKQVLTSSYLIIPLIILLILILVMISNNINFNQLTGRFNHISIALNNVVNNTTGNGQMFSRLTVGLGGRILNPEFSLFANIIAAQGLLGIIAYLYLGFVAVYNGFKLLKRSFKESTYYKLVALLVFIIIFVPILSFFMYPGLLWVILWWISFGLIAAMQKMNLKESKVEDMEFKLTQFKFNRLRILNRNPAIVQTILTLGVLIIGIVVLVGFSRLAF